MFRENGYVWEKARVLLPEVSSSLCIEVLLLSSSAIKCMFVAFFRVEARMFRSGYSWDFNNDANGSITDGTHERIYLFIDQGK